MSEAVEVEVEGAAALAAYGRAIAQAGAAALSGPREELGERLVGTLLKTFEDPQTGPQVLEAFRVAVSSDAGAAQMRQWMSSQLPRLGGEALGKSVTNLSEATTELIQVPPLHANAAAAQVWGLIILRYILKIEPVASASQEELLDLFGPTIQRYYTPVLA
ncbi:TetR/AcrR family transcriptional regulator [Streptomyces zaehneri]|uniref:TetR/AcrR family transcriptional regulator n=1 Tax=Streptomyces zaehneri TaxID=3051180 RepID=UPI0028CFFB40|nr:hypothetical protein [Streptomyces sp. DSM 40713]